MSILLPVFLFALGAVVGSFVLVLVERLHTGSSWIDGSSCCDSCGSRLSPRDLVPVFSWLIARGRCRRCGSRLSPRYILAELALGAAFVLAFEFTGPTLALLPLLAALALLLAIVLYDLRHSVIPFPFSLLLVAAALLFRLCTFESVPDLGMTLLTAGIIGAAFFAFWFLSGGRLMGLGDAPLALALALLAGSQAVAGLLFAFWIGAVVGIAILAGRPRGHRMGVEVPFAPFLALGFLLAIFTQWDPLFAATFLTARFFGA